MAVYHDIDANVRINGSLTLPSGSLTLNDGKFTLPVGDSSNKIELNGSGTAYVIGNESYYLKYGAHARGDDLSIGHKFYRGNGELIANIGYGGDGTPGNRLDSYFAGHVEIEQGLAINKNGDGITFNHNSSTGYSGIRFESASNTNSDFGFIRYYSDASNYRYDIDGSSSENSLLIIGTENDEAATAGEILALQGGNKIVLDVNTTAAHTPTSIVEFMDRGTLRADIDIYGNFTSYGNEIRIKHTGDASLVLESDTDNDSGEVGKPQVLFMQDGGITTASIYLDQDTTLASNNKLVIAPPGGSYDLFIHNQKILHTGNMGSGSGIDADKLRGITGDKFARKDIDVTFNGNITMAAGKTVDGVEISTFKQSYDEHVAVPSPPQNLRLQEILDEVQITFDESSSSNVTHYEVWSSIGDDTSYGLISVINQDEVNGSTTVLDSSYASKTTVYYKVVAVAPAHKSTEITGSISLQNTVGNPANLLITPEFDSYFIRYDLPRDRRLSHIEIKCHAVSDVNSLNESNATLIYSGLSDSFIYDIKENDLDKYHQFWVSSITRS
ncbi:hypothetical protein [Chengkuizengella axinellae]|uniref:Fibronectin type-III domain-containing protein n=1 Tax=Chengkuizengella axinellae TaxID=3064388 RepID=A0ABT9IX40_9BACL|nr:hypothetical protein [Chengkuizengella sp. 2205SS18-9]MDP5273677.1 hypothetical protein [Chengkuizengella sp. 2205SS18-9]